MNIKPTVEEAQRRLRIDDALADDLALAIDQAYAQALAFLDRDALHADAAAFKAAVDAARAALEAETDEEAALQLADDLARIQTGMVATPDLIAAQLMLIDVLVGANSLQEREGKQAAAESMMRRHRRAGC